MGIYGREMFPEASKLNIDDIFLIEGSYYQIIGRGYAVRTLEKEQIPEGVIVNKLEREKEEKKEKGNFISPEEFGCKRASLPIAGKRRSSERVSNFSKRR